MRIFLLPHFPLAMCMFLHKKINFKKYLIYMESNLIFYIARTIKFVSIIISNFLSYFNVKTNTNVFDTLKNTGNCAEIKIILNN